MTDDILVSVIIPVYNVEPYIKESVESVINQTYRNIEIILIDDGSTDNSVKVCEELAGLDSRIKLIRQENLGVVKARGKGINASKGEYILFVDGDDWIDSNMVEVLVKNMKDVDIVTSGMYHEVSEGKIVKKCDKLKKGINDIEYILKNMIYDMEKEYIQPLTSTMWNKLYKAEIVKKVYFTVDSSINFAEDTVFLYKYLLKCKAVNVLEECFYHYRWRESSASHIYRDDRLSVLNKIYITLKADFETHKLKNELNFRLEKWIKSLIFWAINHGMGFNKIYKVPRFIINTYGLENKNIIIYGAGNMGQDAYNQLSKFGYKIKLWVDRDWEQYQKLGLKVEAPNKIFEKDYDVILVAIRDKDIVNGVKTNLINKGIDADKIIWNDPIAIY